MGEAGCRKVADPADRSGTQRLSIAAGVHGTLEVTGRPVALHNFVPSHRCRGISLCGRPCRLGYPEMGPRTCNTTNGLCDCWCGIPVLVRSVGLNGPEL